MRIIVFFDLPVLTDNDKREYRKFRKYLIKSGFLMMQESVYVKLSPNSNAANTVVDNVRKNKPASGLVQSLIITEKQFGKIEFIVGQKSTEIIDNDKRLLIL